mmetsp:Transcript_24558/g.68348  ORF Transcript_24558/g.68348 Transcript_24558/m.68348 type:complete len:238 (-) Transcript_24558:427-1140(-)
MAGACGGQRLLWRTSLWKVVHLSPFVIGIVGVAVRARCLFVVVVIAGRLAHAGASTSRRGARGTEIHEAIRASRGKHVVLPVEHKFSRVQSVDLSVRRYLVHDCRCRTEAHHLRPYRASGAFGRRSATTAARQPRGLRDRLFGNALPPRCNLLQRDMVAHVFDAGAGGKPAQQCRSCLGGIGFTAADSARVGANFSAACVFAAACVLIAATAASDLGVRVRRLPVRRRQGGPTGRHR